MTHNEDHGKDGDYMGKRKDGLSFLWRYGRGEYNVSGQVCHANWKEFRLEAVCWHSSYEARVQGIYHGRSHRTKNGYKTRLSAQKGAERLLFEHLKRQSVLFHELRGKYEKSR